jgi:hypothetical protein
LPAPAGRPEGAGGAFLGRFQHGLANPPNTLYLYYYNAPVLNFEFQTSLRFLPAPGDEKQPLISKHVLLSTLHHPLLCQIERL